MTRVGARARGATTSAWLWAYYFFLKLLLEWHGSLRVHFAWNAILLAFVYVPWRRFLPAPRVARVAAALAGFTLLWYDSYLPPLSESVGFAWAHPGVLTSGFLGRFLPGFWTSASGFATVAASFGVFMALGRRGLSAAPAALIFLLASPLLARGRADEGVSAAVERFYAAESGRRVLTPRAAGRPFDVIVLQVCSLSWDDLSEIGRSSPRLLKGASILLHGFNSASSYSAPAALRLLRAPCGQIPQSSLRSPWPEECRWLDGLRAAGFKTYAALNSEPNYFGMTEELQATAGLDEPVPVSGLPVALLNFDGRPIYDDKALLRRWWTARLASGAPRAMLFYNTVSLHGGAHPDRSGWWQTPENALYARTLRRLGEAVDALCKEVVSSGRSAVVLIVPEHGAALRGSPVQARELRDIPLPAITRVPVAVRLIGPVFARAGSRQDRRPVSYLALAKLVADLAADPTLGADAARLDREVASLPETDFLSESSQWKTFFYRGAYYLYGKDGRWRSLPASVAPTAADAP